MRLEQVLAQWAKGISTASGAREPAVTSVVGRWTNEYGSVAEIGVEGDRLFGTYTSSVGGESGCLSGPINGFVRGDIVGFAVLWPAYMRSITS
ncbi:MAG TPA: avidin/streptavidin family protein [Candidatus Dormibacteraeota bacterium]|nr:avidin/streptavidin family protein [Candidatus Dormibacteraeota bacterium]